MLSSRSVVNIQFFFKKKDPSENDLSEGLYSSRTPLFIRYDFEWIKNKSYDSC